MRVTRSIDASADSNESMQTSIWITILTTEFPKLVHPIS